MTTLTRQPFTELQANASPVEVRDIACAATAIGALKPNDLKDWLRALASRLHTYLDPGILCTAAVFVKTSDRSTWPIESLAWTNGYAPGYRAFLEGCAAKKSPEGLFLGLPQLDNVHAQPITRTRDELLSCQGWSHSPLSASRARHGLYEFVWSAVSVSGGALPRVMVVQCDGTGREWKPGQALSRKLSLLLDCAQQALVAGPLADRERREGLLAALSPMRRKVAPLLASGRSESEIATVLGRSRHTVHEHAKAIYAEWGVNSRYELRDLWFGRSFTDPVGQDMVASETPGIG